MEKIVKQILIKNELWEVHENIGVVGIPFRLHNKSRNKNLWVYDIRQNEYVICNWGGATVTKVEKEDFLEKKKINWVFGVPIPSNVMP